MASVFWLWDSSSGEFTFITVEMPPFPGNWTKSRVVWKLQAVFFCDDYFARKQSDLATESDDEVVRVYFIKCNSVFEWRLYMLYYSATGCSFRWYCLGLKLTSEKMFLISLTKRIARWSWLLKDANDLYFNFISFPGWKDHFSVF